MSDSSWDATDIFFARPVQYAYDAYAERQQAIRTGVQGGQGSGGSSESYAPSGGSAGTGETSLTSGSGGGGSTAHLDPGVKGVEESAPGKEADKGRAGRFVEMM